MESNHYLFRGGGYFFSICRNVFDAFILMKKSSKKKLRKTPAVPKPATKPSFQHQEDEYLDASGKDQIIETAVQEAGIQEAPMDPSFEDLLFDTTGGRVHQQPPEAQFEQVVISQAEHSQPTFSVAVVPFQVCCNSLKAL